MALLDFREHIRRIIRTTNPVEALHQVLHKVAKVKGAWASERALLKQLYLALMHNEKLWKRTAFHWKAVQRELLERFRAAYGKYLQSFTRSPSHPVTRSPSHSFSQSPAHPRHQIRPFAAFQRRNDSISLSQDAGVAHADHMESAMERRLHTGFRVFKDNGLGGVKA